MFRFFLFIIAVRYDESETISIKRCVCTPVSQLSTAISHVVHDECPIAPVSLLSVAAPRPQAQHCCSYGHGHFNPIDHLVFQEKVNNTSGWGPNGNTEARHNRVGKHHHPQQVPRRTRTCMPTAQHLALPACARHHGYVLPCICDCALTYVCDLCVLLAGVANG